MFRQQLHRRQIRPPLNGRRLSINNQRTVIVRDDFFAVAGVGFEMDGEFHAI